ncbi:MAG: hypothetical protein GX790_06960 [Syntrophomonadaceae bacterium]|nr:hypothetical protein [Syntrophomonadaceae bacterium]
MKRLKKVLWILLIISLIGSVSGIALRMSNEAQNNSVVTTIDNREFKKIAANANADLDKVLQDLRDKGVSRVAVKEISLRDLEFDGQIEIKSFSEVKAQIMNDSMNDWQAVLKQIGETSISPINLTAITSDPEVADFMEENFARRYQGDEILNFSLGDKQYFVINTEIAPPVKTEKEVFPTDVNIGFDTNLLDELRSKGFEIVLSPGNSTGTNLDYIDDYDQIIKDYDVKYIIINSEVSGAPDDLEKMEKLVIDNNLIIGLIETPVQLGFLEQKGLPQLIENTDYPVNRLYSTRNDEYLKQVDERYYRWVRGVVDRGIRIVYVVPFQNDKLSYSQNLEDTIQVIGRFHDTMEAKDYPIDEPLNKLSAKKTNNLHRLMVGLSLLFGSVLYLMYLFRMNKKWILTLLGLGVVGLLGINLVLDMDLSKVYALGAAILYPTLSSLILLL